MELDKMCSTGDKFQIVCENRLLDCESFLIEVHFTESDIKILVSS